MNEFEGCTTLTTSVHVHFHNVLTRFRFAEARDLLWRPLDVHVEMRRPLLLRDDGHPLKGNNLLSHSYLGKLVYLNYKTLNQLNQPIRSYLDGGVERVSLEQCYLQVGWRHGAVIALGQHR